VTRRELEQWVAASRARLAARGVTVLFGFGPSIAGAGSASSWASFTAPRGAGRLIRASDGRSRVDVYAFADGSCLSEGREDVTSVGQLEQIADLLAPRMVVH
jgi:hypothetical protein